MRFLLTIALLLSSQAVYAGEASAVAQEDEPITLALADAGTALRVNATWDRIAEGRYDLHRRYAKVFDYSPAAPAREYAPSEFAAFLPRDPVAVGDVWQLDEAKLDPMLRQFHPGATTRLRRGNGQPGAFACLRAVSECFAEIAFKLVSAEAPTHPATLAEPFSGLWNEPAAHAAPGHEREHDRPRRR